MRGFRQVFRFTLKQQLAIKTVRRLTVIVSLLLLIVPPLIMGLIEADREPEKDGPGDPGYTIEVPAVYYASETDDGCSWSLLSQTKLPGFENTEFIPCGSFDEACRAAEAKAGSLILLIREKEGTYCAWGLYPQATDEDPELPDKAQALADTASCALPELYAAEMLSPEAQAKLFSESSSMQILGPDADSETDEDDENAGMKEVISMLLPYVNIMLAYFLVLYFGQSVANCVILEKSSKLMDSFLVSVKPRALIFGKVLATWMAALIQLGAWILSLVAGFAIGRTVVLAINPDSPMELLVFLRYLGQATKLFSLPEILCSLLLIAGGFFLYCCLAGIAGSMASKPEELSSTIGYFTIILVVSLLLTINLGFLNRTGGGAEWIDFVPFTATLVTPSRVLLGQVPLALGLVSLAVTLLLSFVFILAADRVYTAMSLYRGKVPKFKDLKILLASGRNKA